MPNEVFTLGKDWYKNQKFWTVFAPFMFAEDRWAAASEESYDLCSLLDLSPESRILDACCGVGRHTVELSRAGYDAVGVDLTEEFISAARSTSEAENVHPEFVVSDILNFHADKKFNAVINMYTSFGYFPSENDDLMFLKKMKENLLPGGKILIETRGKEIISRDFQENEWYEKDGAYVLAQYGISDDWSLLKNRWIVITPEERYDYSFSQRIYSAAEGKKLLLEAGYADVRAYGNLRGASYDEKAESLVLIGCVQRSAKEYEEAFVLTLFQTEKRKRLPELIFLKEREAQEALSLLLLPGRLWSEEYPKKKNTL